MVNVPDEEIMMVLEEMEFEEGVEGDDQPDEVLEVFPRDPRRGQPSNLLPLSAAIATSKSSRVLKSP